MSGRSLAHLSATVRWEFPSPVQFVAVKRPKKRAGRLRSRAPVQAGKKIWRQRPEWISSQVVLLRQVRSHKPKKDGCYETRRQDIGKMKAFSTKTKTKEIFKGGSKTIQYPPPTTTTSYLIIIPEKPIITTNKIPSLESKSTIRIQQVLITTRPQPQDYSKTKRKLTMKKLAKRIQYTKGLLATRCLLWYTTRFKTRDSLPVHCYRPKSLISKNQTHGMVKLLLPFPSLKKLKIIKTKISTKNRPKTVPKSPYKKKTWCSRTLMVQSLATLPSKRRRSLGFVLVLPVPW